VGKEGSTWIAVEEGTIIMAVGNLSMSKDKVTPDPKHSRYEWNG
jgi:hypothetical protein